MALQDDPRPKSVRVFSRLPVFRTFFLPYNPLVHGRRSSAFSSSSPNTMTDSSIYGKATANTFRSSSSSPSNVLTPWLWACTVAATSGAAYMSCIWFGPSQAATTSPFSTSLARPQVAKTCSVGAHNVASMNACNVGSSGLIRKTLLLSPVAQCIKLAALVPLRFGVRETIVHQTQSPLTGSILAGAATGILTSHVQSTRFRVPVNPARVTAEVITAIVYFELLDNSCQETAVLAGGLAGYVAHRTWRAVPLHGLVFMSYHMLKGPATTAAR